MLEITKTVSAIANELDSLIQVLEAVLRALENQSKEELTDRIGIYARRLPTCKMLEEEREGILDVIRAICTAEFTIEYGKTMLSAVHKELVSTRKLLNL